MTERKAWRELKNKAIDQDIMNALTIHGRATPTTTIRDRVVVLSGLTRGLVPLSYVRARLNKMAELGVVRRHQWSQKNGICWEKGE